MSLSMWLHLFNIVPLLKKHLTLSIGSPIPRSRSNHMFLMVWKAFFGASVFSLIKREIKNSTYFWDANNCTHCVLLIFFFWTKLTWMWRDYCWTTWLVDTAAFTASLAANVFHFFSYQGKCPKIELGCCLWAEKWNCKSCGRWAGKGNMICPWKRGLELLWIRYTQNWQFRNFLLYFTGHVYLWFWNSSDPYCGHRARCSSEESNERDKCR